MTQKAAVVVVIILPCVINAAGQNMSKRFLDNLSTLFVILLVVVHLFDTHNSVRYHATTTGIMTMKVGNFVSSFVRQVSRFPQ